MANRIMLNETSYFGKGAIQEIANEVKNRGCKKVMLCTDPDLLKFKVATKVTDVLDKAGIAYAVYDGIKANPTIENVQEGVAFCKKEEADVIVAVGGGSAIDTSGTGKGASETESADMTFAEGAYDPDNLEYRSMDLRSSGFRVENFHARLYSKMYDQLAKRFISDTGPCIRKRRPSTRAC